MEDEVLRRMNAELKRQMEERKKSLVRRAVPRDRSLVNALNSLRRAELDDIRYNLCVKGVSSLKKKELVAVLASVIVEFSYKWFATIGIAQYNILTNLSMNNGISRGVDQNEVRIDYMRCIGIIFSGYNDRKQQTWYFPKELLAIYRKMDKNKFKEVVSLNDKVVQLTTGFLFYYGYLPYNALFEKVTELIEEELMFIDFIGILINAGCWQENIINVDAGMHYYTVMDYERLASEQIMRKDLEFRKFTYEEIYQAGKEDYIKETDEYKALVGFFMKEFSLSVFEAADMVGELQIILLNDEKFSEMIEYIQSVVEIPNQEVAEKMTALLAMFNNNMHLWSLKGHSPCELSPQCKQAVAPFEAKKAPNNVIQFVPLSSSVGRNDLCPCGSGKKYKKCCLGKEI